MQSDLGPEDLGDLLEQPLIAVLATRRKDDTVMLSPVWFEWRDGGINIWVPTPEGGKVAHVKRDPRVSVVVYNAEWPYKGLELRGTATVSPDGSMTSWGGPHCATTDRRRRNGWCPRMPLAWSSGWNRGRSGRGPTTTRTDRRTAVRTTFGVGRPPRT